MRSGWTKAIPETRAGQQSRGLVGAVAPLLALAVALSWTRAAGAGLAVRVLFVEALGISLVFAAIVWAVRAGTPAAALVGAAICLLITFAGSLTAGESGEPGSVLQTGLPPLIALFVLTFAATRAGRVRKTHAGLAESRSGRNAAQVIANLGVAGLVAAMGLLSPQGALWSIPLLAALAEATADTVSSEIGQAFGGRPVLLTSLRRVDAGTDGAISLRGTGAGMLAAALVAWLGMGSLRLAPTLAVVAWLAGCAGLFFDSLLGATVERRGWLGNDLVNFASTLFAAAGSIGLTILAARL